MFICVKLSSLFEREMIKWRFKLFCYRSVKSGY